MDYEITLDTQKKIYPEQTSTGEVNETGVSKKIPIVTNPIFPEATSSDTSSDIGDTFICSTSTTANSNEDSSTSATTNSKDPKDVQKNIIEFLDSKTIENIKNNGIKVPDIQVSQNEIDEIKKYLDEQAKNLGLNIDINDLSIEERALYIVLTLAHKRGKLSKEEFISVMEKFGNEEVVKAIQKAYPPGTIKVSKERQEIINKKLKSFANIMAITDITIANHMYGKTKEETQDMREKYLEEAALRCEKNNKKLMETMARALPEDCSEEVAKSVLESSSKYIENYNKNIMTLVENAKDKKGNKIYSSKFVEKFKSITDVVLEKIKRNREEYIKNFWNTPKGKIIKNRAKYLAKELKEAKEEYKEQKKVAEEAQVKLKEAESKAEEAKLTLAKITAQRDSCLGEKAIGLSEEQKNKALKSCSTNLYMKQQSATANAEKTSEIANDAYYNNRFEKIVLGWERNDVITAKLNIDMFFAKIANILSRA